MHSPLLHGSTGAPIVDEDFRIAIRILQAWLVLGTIALLCFPSLHGGSSWIGWLPFWLVVAPLADLLILRWRSLLDLSRTAFAALRPRPAPRRAVSRRVKKPRAARRQRVRGQAGATLAALVTDH